MRSVQPPGHLDAGAALAVTSAGAIDNAAGAMLAGTAPGAAGAARITVASLDNAAGRIVARDALVFVTGALDNGNAGTIASIGSTVTIDAARIGNAGGRITGAGAGHREHPGLRQHGRRTVLGRGPASRHPRPGADQP